MSLISKSQRLKEIVATYDTSWFLGDLSGMIKDIGKDSSESEISNLSSPLRQIYYLAGLLISSDPGNGVERTHNAKKWAQIIKILNEIEEEYDKLFFPTVKQDIDKDWRYVRQVAVPSFLKYFNQGQLNYEEQIIEWVRDLFTQLDAIIKKETGLITEDFIQFYENLDKLNQENFRGIVSPKDPILKGWRKYVKLKLVNTLPHFLNLGTDEKTEALFHYMSDRGIINRFLPMELVSPNLPLDKVENIITLLTSKRSQADFLFYTSTNPGNPLFEKPLADIGENLFQVLEVKQVIHAIETVLEKICTKSVEDTTKYIEKKGWLLENKIIDLFKMFFDDKIEIFRNYFIDGFEQDLLILWNNYAFIIEAKGYALREPLRDPEKAYRRIEDDFEKSIGNGYKQSRRVEKKFIVNLPLDITDKNGNLIHKIDTSQYEHDFSIIVNLKSFGQIQCDLATLLKLENEDDIYPWVVTLNDLEIFLLTLKAKFNNPISSINFLLFREELHGKLICSDELEVCGAFITGKLNSDIANKLEVIKTYPDLGNVFDDQYRSGMGFKNEKYMSEKKSGKYIFF
jgi:hypothetical protein